MSPMESGKSDLIQLGGLSRALKASAEMPVVELTTVYMFMPL